MYALFFLVGILFGVFGTYLLQKDHIEFLEQQNKKLKKQRNDYRHRIRKS